MVTRRNFTITAAAALASAAIPAVVAKAAIAPATTVEGFARPITIIVPFAKNGTTDQMARLIAGPLAKVLGVAVNVENITGDWGVTGAVIASKAPADGHTLIMGQMATHAYLPAMGASHRYHSVHDFAPIGLVGVSPMVFVSRKDLPVQDLADLRAYIKVYAEPLAIAHAGKGSASFVAARKMKKAFGTELLAERTYASTPAALQDLAAGRADMMAVALLDALPLVKAGKIKAIGVASHSRNIALPETYTGAQAGFAELKASNWNALFAPKGLAEDKVSALSNALTAALNDHALTRKMHELGIHVPFAEQRGSDALALFQGKEIHDMLAVA